MNFFSGYLDISLQSDSSGTLIAVTAGGEVTVPMDGGLKNSWTGSIGASVPGSTLGEGHVFYTTTSVNQWGENKTSSPCK